MLQSESLSMVMEIHMLSTLVMGSTNGSTIIGLGFQVPLGMLESVQLMIFGLSVQMSSQEATEFITGILQPTTGQISQEEQ